MYVLLLFMEEGQTVGNLCIWKVCNKFIGNQYMESGGGGGRRWARRRRRKRNMEDVNAVESILQRIIIFNGFSITVKTGGVCHLY